MISLASKKVVHEDEAEEFLSKEIPEIFDNNEVFIKSEPITDDQKTMLSDWSNKFDSHCCREETNFDHEFIIRTDAEKTTMVVKEKNKSASKNHKNK